MQITDVRVRIVDGNAKMRAVLEEVILGEYYNVLKA